MTYAKLYTNNTELRERSRTLRIEQTKAEEVLWQELRNNKLRYKFRRQFALGKFIVDFYCHELGFIIELDGPIHDEHKEYDRRREQWLNNQGYYVLRFQNDEVLFEREIVIDKIQHIIVRLSRTSPRAPLIPGEGY